LGSFQVKRGGRLVEKGWRTRAREMLAYLVAYPEGVPKDRLIELLWPEEDLDRANREFDRSVHFIRKDARGPNDTRHYVDKTLDSWRLVGDEWWVDAWEMLRLLDEARREIEPSGKIERLKAAISLYRGEFCDDCYFPWAEPVRERFRSAFLRACAQLAELLADSEDFRQAIDVLDLALEQDPLCEDLARLAIRIEASAGRPRAARRRYDLLKATLGNELAVEPDPETQALMRQIQRGSTKTQVAV
jgi:DNA-binding SARP family transcriptional activator